MVWPPLNGSSWALPPVLLSHGEQDPVVPFAASEEVLRRLEAAGGSGAVGCQPSWG